MSPADPARLRRRFEETGGLTVGIEEEVMLLDPETLDLTPRVDDLMARVENDDRFTAELPAAQIEILTRAEPPGVRRHRRAGHRSP